MLMILGAGVGLGGAACGAEGVVITEQAGKLRVEINGEWFTEYVFSGAPHVYFHPLMGPGGVPMTRSFPMVRDSVGEAHDHPHHRSLWYAHGSANGVDFWSESSRAGKILHDRFLEIKSGRDAGVIRSVNRWEAPDGTVVCSNLQTLRVYAGPAGERLFDFEVTYLAGDRELVLGDTKEGSMAMRVASTMRLTGVDKKPGKGDIVLSTGIRGKQTWGKRAAWCDYYGPVQDKTVGVAIFDHPQNPRHPTWWHVRDYGLFAANPFGIHDFERKPAGTGHLKVPAGGQLTFKYRFYLHAGDTEQARVAERYRAWTGQ
ncbi:MAG: PmoA family protein [Verrucomicrobia bacterium]|nr:PmoA family protein [Verrucomicrobiota bacterium]